MKLLGTLIFSLILIFIFGLLGFAMVIGILGFDNPNTSPLWVILIDGVIGFFWFLSIWAFCRIWKPYYDKLKSTRLFASIRIHQPRLFWGRLLVILIILFISPFLILLFMRICELVFKYFGPIVI